MYEEFLRQAREFDQSLWGQLFYFLGGMFFVGCSIAWWFLGPSRYKTSVILLGLLAATCWDINYFLEGQLFYGGILAGVILAGVTAIVGVKNKKEKA